MKSQDRARAGPRGRRRWIEPGLWHQTRPTSAAGPCRVESDLVCQAAQLEGSGAGASASGRRPWSGPAPPSACPWSACPAGVADRRTSDCFCWSLVGPDHQGCVMVLVPDPKVLIYPWAQATGPSAVAFQGHYSRFRPVRAASSSRQRGSTCTQKAWPRYPVRRTLASPALPAKTGPSSRRVRR